MFCFVIGMRFLVCGIIVLFVCLGFVEKNLITGLSEWQALDQALGTQEPVPDQRTGQLSSLRQTQSDPQLSG